VWLGSIVISHVITVTVGLISFILAFSSFQPAIETALEHPAGFGALPNYLSGFSFKDYDDTGQQRGICIL